MAKQMPILFEEDHPKKNKRISSQKKMQSHEDWTPQPLPPEEQTKPTADEAASEEAKPKRRRAAPRTGKPRASRAKAAPPPAEAEEGEAGGAEAAPDRKREERQPASDAPQAAPAGESAGERRDPAREAEEAGSKAGGEEPRQPRQRRENRREAEQGPREQESGREANNRQRHPQDQGRRGDREDRHHRHGGGHPHHGQGGGHGHGGGHGPGARGKKKKNKKNRFERQGGGGGGPQHGGGARMGDLPDLSRFQDINELARVAAESATGEPLYLNSLYEVSLHDLVEQAAAMGVVLETAPNRRILISRMLQKAAEEQRPIVDQGVLEITDAGYGLVVRHANNYHGQSEDPFVAETFIRRFGLKQGHIVEVQVQPPEGSERCPAVVRLIKVMEREPEEVADIVPFEDLVPYYPLQRMLLEVPGEENKDVSMRAVDLLTPIGFGQRGLIVAPPRTGKTVLLQQIANSVATNNPDAHLIVLLIDERPEEVTDFRRNVKGEVVSSTFDEPAGSHVEVAEMVIEKARRMVESGRHVVILLDSITRLARAYNTMMPSSGKILSGGVEANALQKPKRFFGAARNIEGGGSLTILATALVDTGSRMDEVIFEEFKGTGNMEIHLDRALIDKRIFPALNIEKSGTRKEELLYHPDEMNRIYSLRRAIQGVPIVEAMEMLVTRLKKTKSNAEFLMGMNR